MRDAQGGACARALRRCCGGCNLRCCARLVRATLCCCRGAAGGTTDGANSEDGAAIPTTAPAGVGAGGRQKQGGGFGTPELRAVAAPLSALRCAPLRNKDTQITNTAPKNQRFFLFPYRTKPVKCSPPTKTQTIISCLAKSIWPVTSEAENNRYFLDSFSRSISWKHLFPAKQAQKAQTTYFLVFGALSKPTS